MTNDTEYIDAKEAAKLLDCKVSSLYRLKGIHQVRREDRAKGRLTFRYYHRGDVVKLAEWRASDAFAREHRQNKAKAGQAPRSKQVRVEKSEPELEEHETNSGVSYRVAPPAYEVRQPYN